ncbi:InlB B-repeat-containing protein [Kallipyga massiliensis]|uniref:InlB B-repeat-containing protein n=1 Tax=Kallipyga massiliensis TaxID=1472764 RepID=UPI0026ED6038|nr:InlB B-repeat-containing protein [Kallipyga massiliensis]
MVLIFLLALTGYPRRVFAQEEEKAITLIKNGSEVGHFDSIKEAIGQLYELTKNGSKFNFVVEVNKDIELTEYSQFGFPYGEVTLRSKNPEKPKTIKANVQDHNMMLGVVNGAHLSVENIIIDGNHQARLIWVESTDSLPAQLTINDGAILENGKVQPDDQTKIGGGIYCQYAGDVTINGGIIRNNKAIQAGGGIAYIGTRTLTINGGEIYGNQVPSESGFGGGIVLQGKGLVNGGKIYGNLAYDGGGIATGKNANLEIKGGEVSGNTASYAGGGIYLFKNSIVKLSGGQVSNNKGKQGGGVTAAFNSHFIMEGSGLISGNEAYTGGGVYPWGTTPACDLISGTIEKNKANFGGGIRLRSPKTKIAGVIFRENIANYGGGIYSSLPDGETITIDGVKLIKNEALSGGGVCLPDGGALNFQNAHFEGNTAHYGGGIWTSRPMTIEKTSFTGNEAVKSEPPILPNGKHENNGHGGAIYVNTDLAKDGIVTVDGCTFTANKADKSGGAISIDETHGLVKVVNHTVFEGNQATGELGHGGAIYSNLHAYNPEYDDGSTGPLVQPPTAKDYYLNINTDATTVFKNNKAFRTFTPPSTKDEFDKLLYQSTSHPGTKYDHPLNNDDVNLIVFNEVIFDLNYDTEDPIHAAYLVLEKSKLGEDFPEDPVRKGYQFVEWNTQKDGKGTKFTKDTVIEGDITLYAIYKMKQVVLNEAPQLVVEDKTIKKGEDLDLKTLIVSATDKEDGDLKDKVELIDDGGFDKDKVGEYTITFKVTDSIGASITKKAKVIVKGDPETPTPGTPTPDKPTPDKPSPDKPTSQNPTPDKPTPQKPGHQEKRPGKPTPSPKRPSGGKTAKPKTKPGKVAPKTGDAAILSFYAPSILVAGGAMAFLRKRRADR